jgi:hypothetical protein
MTAATTTSAATSRRREPDAGHAAGRRRLHALDDRARAHRAAELAQVADEARR